jgi:hypothetical protein
MRLSIQFPRTGIWARAVVIIILVLIVSRWSPGIGIPLSLGSWLGWAAAGPRTRLSLPRPRYN